MSEPSDNFAHWSLEEILASVASHEPTPGAGPSLAWTCSLAAALVEMVSAVTLRQQTEPAIAVQARRDQAHELRSTAMSLAEVDAAAYRDVLAVQRDRDAPDRAQRLRQALADAADPLVQIVETAQAVTELAEAAVRDARGGVRGEALTAIVLAAGVVRAGVPLVELNLTGHPDDPRRGLVRASSVAAEAALERMVGPPAGAA